MRSVLSIPGIFYVLKTSIILSLAYTHRPTVGKIIAFNLCTQNHCEDCSGGEVLKCSNGAIFDRYGDLCGCCQSCVRFQDLGESCGSQLAVRSSENLRVSRPRVAILAATRCKKNLICKNFICKRIYETVDREINNEQSSELRSKSITTVNPTELYNEHSPLVTGLPDVEYRADEFTTQGSEQSREVASLPIVLSRKTTIDTYENEKSSREMELDIESEKNIIFDPSGHLINVLVGARELQLIYGHEALADFNILIESIDKALKNSMLKKNETEELYERFKEAAQFAEAIKDRPNTKKYNSIWTSFNIEIPVANKNLNLSKTVGGAAAIAVQPDFVPRAHVWKVLNSGTSSRNIRTKRELENGKELVDAKVEENQKEINEQNNDQYPEISVYDVINKTPREIEDFERWLSTRTMERNPDDKPLDSDETDSEINIHITGLPRVTNQSLEAVQLGEKNIEDVRIDSELDVRDVKDDANSDVNRTSEDQTEKSTNFTTSNVLQDRENHDITESLGEKLQVSNNNYEFTFPEYPVVLDNKRDADRAANETTDEIRAQLDRIETRAIVIEDAVHDIINKIDISRRYEEAQREMVDPNDESSVEDDEMFRESKPANPKNENATNLRASSNGPRHKNVIMKNPRLNEFHPKRSSRQWRTQQNLWDVPKVSRPRRRRLHRNEERHQTERDWESSDQRRQKYLPTRRKNPMEDTQKHLERRKLPMLLSNRDWKSSNLHDRHEDSWLASREQSDLEVGSNTPEERSARPFDFSRALPVGRTTRRIKQDIRASGRHQQTGNPAVEESIIFLETQIPRSTRPTDASYIGDPMKARSMRLITKYDDDDWNLRANTYLSNLFAAQEGNSEFGRSELPETLISSMDSSATNENHQESGDTDDSYWLLPGDLDYAERTEPKDDKVEIAKSDLGQTSSNLNQHEPTNSSLNRTKRDASTPFSPKPKLNLKRQSCHRSKTLASKCDDGSSNANNTGLDLKSSKTIAKNPNVPQNGPTHVKNPPGRSRRSVQMVDWLRAAQEYHERLRGLRAAALKTWLASREIITDANVTSVKLFTREIPPHLETYGAESFEENFDDIPDEGIEDYPADFREAEDPTAASSEILTDIFVDQSSPREHDSESKPIAANERDEQRLVQVSSLSGPRKLTITTNGNSTIRIEDVTNLDDGASHLTDQMTQDSTADEVSHKIPITASDTDYFDHMYESFDTDDGDFNYGDSTAGWINEFDSIDPPNKKDPRKNRPRESSYEKAQRGSPGRYKRNSPLVIFKANGDRQKDILVWPSNWRDLIHRHLRLNRSGSNSPKTTKRRAYLGPRKIFSMPVSSKFNTGAKIDERKN